LAVLRILRQEAGSMMYWRVRVRLPERFGQPCKVLAFGKMNSALVEFEDGYKVITSRWYVSSIQPKIPTTKQLSLFSGDVSNSLRLSIDLTESI
jgi:hypothetical protein